jgi:hypothetical protein
MNAGNENDVCYFFVGIFDHHQGLHIHSKFPFSSDLVLATTSRPLLAAAVRFQVPRLGYLCENFIGNTLNLKTVVDTLNWSTDLKLIRLNKCCSDFIAANVNNVMATNTLHKLQPEALKDLIFERVISHSFVQNESKKLSFQLEKWRGEEKEDMYEVK